MGIREKPERTNSASALVSALPASSVTMSGRGTMTSRTSVLLSSNMDWSIVRSSSASCSDWLTRSTMSRRSSTASSRASASVSLGSGVSAAASAVAGRVTARTRLTNGSSAWSTRPGSRVPTRRGVVPATTAMSRAATRTATRSTCHHWGSRSATTRVSDTAVVSSASTRARTRPGRARSRSPASRSTAAARGRSATWSSLSAVRPIRRSADSAATSVAVTSSAIRARTSSHHSGMSGRSPSMSALGEEGEEELALEREHLVLLLRLGVVEAEQVEDAVRGEEEQLLGGAVTGGLGLGGGDLRAEHDVAEHALDRRLPRDAGAQLVHREGQDVGGARLVHPLLVELAHDVGRDEEDRQLGLRVDVELFEDVAGQRRELLLGDLVPGLVGDLDAHDRPPRRCAARRSARLPVGPASHRS